jgi:alkylation response protein AidB-like acyl-CoA dehydrogenase
MLAGAREPGVRRTLQLRIAAFEAVLAIEQARDRYLAERGHAPEHIDALVAAGYLAALPVDPYGGRFYLDADGRVASTSKFAFAGQAQGRKQTTPTVPRETAP